MSEKRKTYSLTFNKGIDKSSAPFEADPSRALDALNYIYRDGKVQKRYGAVNILNAEATQYVAVSFLQVVGNTIKTNSKNFNGLWRFEAEDGNRHIVAHIGKLIYEIKKVDDEWVAEPIRAESGLYNSVAFKCYEFEDYKSTAVIGGKMLYFFGGNKLVRIRFFSNGTSIRPVEDGNGTYVPTTSISITYENAKKSGRASLDEVNLMTQWRKNLLLSGVGVDTNEAIKSNTKGYKYQLDAPIVGKLSNDVKSVRIKIARRK